MAGGKQYIRDKGWTRGIDSKKIHHINNGVDLEEFAYNREHFQIQDEDLENKTIFKVVYTGSIRKVNNLGQLVACAQRLQKEEPSIKFLIWGDGAERKELEKRCRKLALSNISFKGSVEKKYIPYILSRADVNLLHGEHTEIMSYGCSPNKLFDYLAAGQLIVSDLGSNYDLLEKYHCGIVTEEQGSDRLGKVFQQCFAMTEQEKKEYKRYMEECAKAHDYRTLTDKLEEILEHAERKDERITIKKNQRKLH